VNQPPTFSKLPESAETVEGQMVRFVAAASGKPAPTLTWLRDEQPVEESEHLTIHHSQAGQEVHAVMTMPAALIEQESDKYKVQASNVAGIHEEEFSLTGKAEQCARYCKKCLKEGVM
jgi:hypothetical protein